jgi:very-short-patch-repair endonuclease
MVACLHEGSALKSSPLRGEVPSEARGRGELRKEGEYRVTAKARSLRQNMTKAEVFLWMQLRKRALNGARFRRQHPVGPCIADFVCPAAKLIVEVDGATHSTADELAHDARRTKYLESEGWTVIRVNNSDVYENMDGVWRTIAARLAPPLRCAQHLPASGED